MNDAARSGIARIVRTERVGTLRVKPDIYLNDRPSHKPLNKWHFSIPAYRDLSIRDLRRYFKAMNELTG